MANKRPQDRKPKTGRRTNPSSSTWDELVNEATVEPYILGDPDGNEYEIHQPTGADAREIRAAIQDSSLDDEDVFRLLVGDKIADTFAPHFEAAPATVVTSLVIKLSNHFNSLADPTSRT